MCLSEGEHGWGVFADEGVGHEGGAVAGESAGQDPFAAGPHAEALFESGHEWLGGVGQAAQPSQGGQDESVEAGEHGDGRSGHAEEQGIVAHGGEEVFAGSDVEAVEKDGESGLFRALAGEVAFAVAGAAGGDDDFGQVAGQDIHQGDEVIGDHAGTGDLHAVFVQQAACEDEVVGRDAGLGLDAVAGGVAEFAAQGQDLGAHRGVGVDGAGPGADHDGCGLGGDDFVCAGDDRSQFDFAAGGSDEPARAHGGADEDGVAVDLHVFFGQDRVAALGHDAAGEHAGGLVLFDRGVGARLGAHGLGHGQPDRVHGPCVFDIRGAHGIAVSQGAGLFRHVAEGGDVVGGDASDGLGGVHSFGFAGRGVSENALEGAASRDESCGHGVDCVTSPVRCKGGVSAGGRGYNSTVWNFSLCSGIVQSQP